MMDVIYDGKEWLTEASRDLDEGETVNIVDTRWLEQVERDSHSVQLGFKNFRVPQWNYINHSCEPNSKIVQLHNDKYALYIIRPTEAGQEITFNYFENEDEVVGEFRCTCGSSKCKDRVG